MNATTIQTWYNFVLAQYTAESYLNEFDSLTEQELNDILIAGANNPEFIKEISEAELSATRMTDVMIADFSTTWTIIDHLPNTTSGFSATVLQNTHTGEFTLSFRSTESKPATLGGDVERDSRSGANGEIASEGFAYAQLLDMEEYFSSLKNGER